MEADEIAELGNQDEIILVRNSSLMLLPRVVGPAEVQPNKPRNHFTGPNRQTGEGQRLGGRPTIWWGGMKTDPSKLSWAPIYAATQINWIVWDLLSVPAQNESRNSATQAEEFEMTGSNKRECVCSQGGKAFQSFSNFLRGKMAITSRSSPPWSLGFTRVKPKRKP